MQRQSVDTIIHKNKQTSAAYNAVTRIIYTLIPIKCSQKNNAKWHIEDFFHAITAMCNGNSYAESTMNELSVSSEYSNPCGKWIRNSIRSVNPNTLLLGLSDAMDDTVLHLKKLGMLKKSVTVAIDKHLISRYDKSTNPFLINSKPKDSITLFEAYGTIQCVGEQCRAQIGATPIKKGGSIGMIVRKLINDYQKCSKNQLDPSG